jgi:DNA-binding SARP family transcriptional activator
MFCYLLLYRDRPLPRETLAGVLWENSTTSQSKKYLRQILWQLNVSLHSLPEPIGTSVFLVEPDWIRLNPEADLWFDVAEFEQAFANAKRIPGRELDSVQVGSLQEAIQLYKGHLLEGWYQDWCLFERERLQLMYLTMLDKLMNYCETHNEYERGLRYGTRIMAIDRARERTHRRLMRLYYLTGDRSAALRQYERCAEALEEELGVKPSKRTFGLLEQIQQDHLDYPSLSSPESLVMQNAMNSPLQDIRDDLKQLNIGLSDIQRRVHLDIQRLELALKEQL